MSLFEMESLDVSIFIILPKQTKTLNRLEKNPDAQD